MLSAQDPSICYPTTGQRAVGQNKTKKKVGKNTENKHRNPLILNIKCYSTLFPYVITWKYCGEILTFYLRKKIKVTYKWFIRLFIL